ncbi:HlyD family type I secretion periplasmic adaptor subunit [Sphingomonas donggukensis]|uniref:Membrane fusion protein (MFP) family protein n=1 Tax=Sphingomonas donggukensis TaxID=2949093 RepID=A0ABY4TV10_9SPHN|nr:HlyD family type I secretion periplasmic adaptor subunit [Sphingomonas donggukensis]URW76229.1 HlyD family type I secretion periplasmic adaptor subunit [Sphingomonas donggukensis]
MTTDTIPAPHHHIEDMATRIQPRTASTMLLWAIGGFFVVALAWASFTRLDRTVHAAGRVVPGSRMQVISNLEGGIVSRILVKQGDQVKKGDTLVVLDRTASGAELGTGEVQAASLAAKIARLDAEIRGREPVYPTTGGSVQLGEQIAIERALHLSRMADLASASNAGAARIQQAQRAVAEAQAAYQSRTSAARAYQQQVDMVRPLVDRGIEPRLSLVQLENNLTIAQSDSAAAAATIARAQASVAEATAARNQQRQDWRAQAATELATAQAEYAARTSALPALADRARRTTIVAPLSGRINRVAVATVGGIVGAGQPIVELVPSEDLLQVEALVNPKDIANVRIGQHARLNISAYDSAVYGGMDGEVVTISPDATLDERTGESHYTVRVRANAASLKGHDGRTLPIGPGMTVDVNLLGDKRSVLSYLFTPISRLSERALRE